MRVNGRVQGVFYRESVRRLASELEVAGSAVNRDDGSVEVVLEGPREAVENVICFCADGPDLAEVSGVAVAEENPKGESGFSTG